MRRARPCGAGVSRAWRGHPLVPLGASSARAPRAGAGRSRDSGRDARTTQCRMRGQTAPANFARQAKLVEDQRVVAGDSTRQDLRLPRIGRRLESLQLPDDFQDAAFGIHLRPRGKVLPAEQPAHELSSRNRLDLPAQSAECEPMNARQKPAVAPFQRASVDPHHPARAGLSESEVSQSSSPPRGRGFFASLDDRRRW